MYPFKKEFKFWIECNILASSKRKCKKQCLQESSCSKCVRQQGESLQRKIVKIISNETKNSLNVFKPKFEETKMYLLSAQSVNTVSSMVSSGSWETKGT